MNKIACLVNALEVYISLISLLSVSSSLDVIQQNDFHYILAVVYQPPDVKLLSGSTNYLKRKKIQRID